MAADLTGGSRPTSYRRRGVHRRGGLRTCDVFIVTTKQARFAQAIMRRKGNLRIPDDRVFSQTVSVAKDGRARGSSGQRQGRRRASGVRGG